jgi:hypothetical protein
MAQTKGKTATATTRGGTRTGNVTPATPSRPVSTGRAAAGTAPARTKPVAQPEPEILEEDFIETEQATEEVPQDDVETGNPVASAGDDLLNLSTSELDSPARKPDAHRGRVIEIQEHHSENKGTPAIRILLHSDDADFDGRMDVYVPRPFEEDIHVDPRELSKVKDEEAGTSNEQMQYAMSIHNKRNDATIDKLRMIAKEEGRSLEGYEGSVDTFADYIQALNTLCADLPLIFFRRPRKDNPNFLEVHDFLSIAALDNPKMQGKFKGKQLAWASE